MNLIDLAQEKGLEPKRTSSHGGGEYHSACPNCQEGTDRFAIWPHEPAKNCMGRYWCRICDSKGDAIQFCRDFLGLSYVEACDKLSLETRILPKKISASLKQIAEPPAIWQEQAGLFVEWCHQQLWLHPTALDKLYKRGFTKDSIQRFRLGYCPQDTWKAYSDWGMSSETKADGKSRILWMPKGLVVPWISNKKVLKINIRRLEWHPEDKYGKYIKIPGSMNCPAVYGDPSLPIGILLESEFDALLIQQEASHHLFCLANGGSCQPMDLQTDCFIRKKILLFCPDVDLGGAKFLNKLQEIYKNGILWPAPIGKSPGDAFTLGVNLQKWILQGIKETQSFKKQYTHV